jgi:hypothetical protein
MDPSVPQGRFHPGRGGVARSGRARPPSPATIVALIAALAGLPAPSRACPRSVLGAPAVDHIPFEGDTIRVAVEHYTPMTLARWTEKVTLLFGGASKFALGTLEDTETSEKAVIPFAALRSLTVEQGDDYDDNAPFCVRLELALLHRPDPFTGSRRAFEPRTGVAALGSWYVETIPNQRPDAFDPYGQSYGDYFADPDLVLSFVHGPPAPGLFTTAEAPKPHGMNPGLAPPLYISPDDRTVAVLWRVQRRRRGAG